MNTRCQYQLMAVHQALYSDVKIIFELRNDADMTFKLPALDVAHNSILMAAMSPQDVKRVMYFANILESSAIKQQDTAA